MLAKRGVKLRAKTYFWGCCLAVGLIAPLAIGRLSADDTDPGKTAGRANSARLEDEIQRLHEELASTKELLREATSNRGELRLAQRGNDPPADPQEKTAAKTADGQAIDTDAWRSLDKELARRHPGMREGFPGGPPPWARHGFHGGPPWAHHRGHGHGGPPCAHHRHHGWRHWARHGRHGGPHHRAHRHHHGQDRGWERSGSDRFGPGPRGGDAMSQIARRLDLLERKIDALMREVHTSGDGPDRGAPRRDGPPHEGPPRDGPPPR